MEYDPTQYRGAAQYYLRGRPPYSAQLGAVLADELGLDGPGRTDIVRDIDGVIAGYLSMSFAAPHLFGQRLDDFIAELRTVLETHSPTGRFWDWPGDTEVLIARRR